jgi:fatty-acyl-CoA synthase
VREAFARRGVHFRLGYGMTECGVNCFALGNEEAQQHPDSVGRPMPGLDAVIRTPDGAPVAAGAIGELTLRGQVVCAGYFRKPAESAATIRDGWLWTGDLARQDEAGRFYICGRRKEMYISGGENVYPAEVEAALSQCQGVSECAVIGVPHARWGETGLAAVAARPGAKLSVDLLRTQLKARLAGYKVPTEFLFLDALPKTGAGKIDKPAIRALCTGAQVRAAGDAR